MERIIKGIATLAVAFLLLGVCLFAIESKATSGSQSQSIDQSVQALTERLRATAKNRASGAAYEPVNCEALYDLLQAAQEVYLENCPGL